jgi:5-methylcytosine-specific restriction enzyme subunit McrC
MALTAAIRGRMSSSLLRGYVAREEEAMVVRGRLDLAETIRRRPALLLPLVQEPEALEEDIPENRILRSALDALLPRVSTPSVRGHLLDRQRLFADVSRLPPHTPLPRLRRYRLNACWWDTIELAALVLRGCGLDLPAGRTAARSFVVDMNVVCERFLYRALADALRPSGKELQHCRTGLFLDEERHHALEPDLSLWSGSRCVFAGDCKYKASDDAHAERNDIFQVLAYAVGAGLSEATLIYGGGTVRVRVLDLGALPPALRAQLATIAAECGRPVGPRHGPA